MIGSLDSLYLWHRLPSEAKASYLARFFRHG
jgi:hypothetical protein